LRVSRRDQDKNGLTGTRICPIFRIVWPRAHDDRVRSYLFVPGDAPERFEPASTHGADAVVIDLADAVDPEHKDAARAAVAAWLEAAADSGPRVWVRINPGELGHRDVHALVGPALTGVCVAGTTSASQLAALAAVLAEAEEAHRLPVGRVAVAPVLETAAAVLGAAEIARAPRVTRLQLNEDRLRVELRVEPGPEEHELAWARSMVVLASAAAGVEAPVGPPPGAGGSAPEHFRTSTATLRRLGFRGRACLDPAQVAIVNDVFSGRDAP
jgi:citrate lyase subunit beta / citryl-CoA lyase